MMKQFLSDFQVEEYKPTYYCANCDRDLDESCIVPLIECDHLSQRLSPGETVPAGECQACGALVHQSSMITQKHTITKGEWYVKVDGNNTFVYNDDQSRQHPITVFYNDGDGLALANHICDTHNRSPELLAENERLREAFEIVIGQLEGQSKVPCTNRIDQQGMATILRKALSKKD